MHSAIMMRDKVVLIDQHPNRNIGLMCLSTDPTVERDFRQYLPADKYNLFVNRVEFNPPVTNENLKKIGARLKQSASLIAPDEPLEVITYCCTSCATNLGDQCVIDALGGGRPGVPAINPALSGRTAMKAMGIKSIGLVTPYIQEVSDSVAQYFEDFDIHVAQNYCMGLESDYEISRVSDQTMIDASLQANTDQVDAIFLSCAALPAVNVIKTIEDKIGKPVVSSNSSMIWMALRTIGIKDQLDLGKLFEYDLGDNCE